MEEQIALARQRRQRNAELAAEARYARERHDLYKARTYGASMTSPGRLRELAQARDAAELRLRRAQEAPATAQESAPDDRDIA